MAAIEFLIFYKPGDKVSNDFLNDYNKRIKEKATAFGVKIQVIDITRVSRSQAASLTEYIKRNIYPFAFVINGQTKVVYTNIEQIYELVVAAIKNAKEAAQKSSRPAKTTVTRYDDYGSIDYIEQERRKTLASEQISDEEIIGHQKGDIYSGDIHTSMILPRSAPVQNSRGNIAAVSAGQGMSDDPNRLGYESHEMEMINRSMSDFDDIDMDLRNHLQSNVMVDPGQEEMMGSSTADRLNPSGLF